MRLLTLWQRRAQQKCKWIGLPATLRWRPSSRPSNKASSLEHPRYNKTDPYDLLTRRKQVTVFRLRTGHNHLNYHLYSKLCIGHTEQCPCGTGSQTAEHLLQSCPLYKLLRKRIWPDHTLIACKLYNSLGDLRCTATFTEETGEDLHFIHITTVKAPLYHFTTGWLQIFLVFLLPCDLEWRLVIQSGIKLCSFVISITIPSLKEINLPNTSQPKQKSVLKVCF